jgi:hypothetical protein
MAPDTFALTRAQGVLFLGPGLTYSSLITLSFPFSRRYRRRILAIVE